LTLFTILILGLTYATNKGNRSSILNNVEVSKEEQKLTGIIPQRTSENEMKELKEKYNEWFSKVNQLSEKKIELSNNIKLKTNNRDMMRKARYAATGNDPAGKKAKKSSGNTFTLVHVISLATLFFLVGLYYGKS
jgi:hypothetical protein